MDLYAENILEHYRNPRHKNDVDCSVEHEEANHACGDIIKIQLQLEDGKIAAIGWSGTGCAISQAGMSILSEELENISVEDAKKLDKESIYELLGVPIGPRRFKCALICLHTLKNALRKAESLESQGWLDTVEIDEE